MAAWEAAEMSLLSLSNVRERMREKKKGALRAAKLNASLASKIKTKIINNSSTMKISLKQNNKALALALNAEKANAQRLTQEKTILQKEVKQCHFQNAVLRHRLYFLNNMLEKMDNLMAAVKMAELSEFHTNSASLSSGQKSILTENSWVDDIVDGQLLRVTQIPMRVPISKLHDAQQQAGSSTAVQTSSGELQKPASNAGELQRPASNEALKIVPVASKDTLPPQHNEKPQFHWEDNGKKVTEAMATEGAFHDSHIFGEVLYSTEQNPNNLPTLGLESHTLSYEADEMAKHLSDSLSHGHVTQRRKRSTLFATSTPSSALDIVTHVSSTQAAWGSTAQDNSSSSRNNTQQQLRPPSPLASPAQTAVISPRNSVGKETFCEQPQTKEMGCGVETDPSYSQVPEFVPVKVKSKGKCKTGEKKTVKKARSGKKKTPAESLPKTNNAQSSPDRSQGEECAQNAKKLLQPKAATRSSETEACEMGQKAFDGAFDRRSRDCGEHYSHSCDGVQDLGSTYEVNPAQLQSLENVDLMQQVKKGPIFEMQSMESSLKSPVHTFSSHEVASGDSSLQNSTRFSSVSRKSIRQKANGKTRVIRQSDDSDEEYLPKTVIIRESKAEERPKRSQTSRKNTVRISSCDQRNEVNVFRPCIDVQGVANESTKDLPGNLKQRRETYIVHPLDLAGNVGCFQTESEGAKNVPPKSVLGSKVSKIPRARKSNKKQTGGLQEKGQGEVDHTMNSLKKEASCKPRPQLKRSKSQPPETDSLARKSDGAKVLIGSSTEHASCHVKKTVKFSCISHLVSELDDFLEEQLPEISLADSLTHSLESSHMSSSAVLPVGSRLTEVPVSKSLSTEGNRLPEKPPVWMKKSLIFKENTSEEIPGERNQVQSSSWNLPEPDIRPLQELNSPRVLSHSGLEETSGCSSRRKRKPACYKEPSIRRKLRQGDPFTDTEFLHPSLYKSKKKPVTTKRMTKMKENKELLPEGCLSAKAQVGNNGKD